MWKEQGGVGGEVFPWAVGGRLDLDSDGGQQRASHLSNIGSRGLSAEHPAREKA